MSPIPKRMLAKTPKAISGRYIVSPNLSAASVAPSNLKIRAGEPNCQREAAIPDHPGLCQPLVDELVEQRENEPEERRLAKSFGHPFFETFYIDSTIEPFEESESEPHT